VRFHAWISKLASTDHEDVGWTSNLHDLEIVRQNLLLILSRRRIEHITCLVGQVEDLVSFSHKVVNINSVEILI
jgi:hypothetical protein